MVGRRLKSRCCLQVCFFQIDREVNTSRSMCSHRIPKTTSIVLLLFQFSFTASQFYPYNSISKHMARAISYSQSLPVNIQKVTLTDSYWVTVVQIKPITNRLHPSWLRNWWGVTCRPVGVCCWRVRQKEGHLVLISTSPSPFENNRGWETGRTKRTGGEPTSIV